MLIRSIRNALHLFMTAEFEKFRSCTDSNEVQTIEISLAPTDVEFCTVKD